MIIAENISKSFKEVKALNDLSFKVNEGELFGFIGPDGAGKTTLFRILTSLLIQTSGTATVFGYDVVKDYRKIREITGYMPGRFSLYSDLSVEENLEFFATVFGTSIKENYDLIHNIYVQIEPFKNRLAGKLSGGMKQKLALSCALIHHPKILVLDEPTTGVDAVSRKEFWELLQGLKERGITIIVSTPYMDEARLCDRVALIQQGSILSVDEPDAIIKNYNKKVYSISSENLYQLINDLREYPTTINVFAFGQDVHFSEISQSPDSDRIVEFLKEKGHVNVSVSEITPGIEDVFIGLMRDDVTEKNIV